MTAPAHHPFPAGHRRLASTGRVPARGIPILDTTNEATHVNDDCKTATEKVDVALADPVTRGTLVEDFAQWLERRAQVAQEAKDALVCPMAEEDVEIGLTPEGLAYGARAAVAGAAPWSNIIAGSRDAVGDVDITLVQWLARLSPRFPDGGPLPAWVRKIAAP